jgi:streptogrisin C
VKYLGTLALAGLISLAATTNAATVTGSTSVDDELVRAAGAERATLGLSSDPAFVEWLLSSGVDVGTGHLGIPLTSAEEAALRFDMRARFADEVANTVIPYLESLDNFGGAYIDQPSGGGLVVVLTRHDAAAEAEIARLAPSDNLGIRVEYARSTAEELRNAMRSAWELNGQNLGRDAIWSVGIDYSTNSIHISIRPGASDGTSEADLSAILGVDVRIVEEPFAHELACNTRDNCASPMRAGIRIYQGGNPPNDEALCTMGFHIELGADEQFLTAGHCGFAGSNDWFHPGLGAAKIGSELATLYAQFGDDAMRVQMSDAQDSSNIYGSIKLVTSARNSIQGEGICASLGNTNNWDCGTVVDADDTWTGEACQCTLFGGDSDNIAAMPGDSGSPMVNNTAGDKTAIGSYSNAAGNFAEIGNVLTAFGAQIRF